MSRLRRLLHGCQWLVPDAPPGLTILGYHLVGAGSGSAIDLPLGVFRRQMDELAELGRVRPLETALGAALGGPGDTARTPGDQDGSGRRHVVLTFDDGYENFYSEVWPILRERRLPAMLYVQVGFLSDSRQAPIANAGRLPPLTWDQLGELAASDLISIGSHTCTHPDLRALEGDALEQELESSKAQLESRLGCPVDSFCYPRGQWSKRVEHRVARHYRTAVIRGGRTMRSGRFSPHRLERVPVRRDMPESLRPVLDSSVWLEEWLASKTRRLLF